MSVKSGSVGVRPIVLTSRSDVPHWREHPGYSVDLVTTLGDVRGIVKSPDQALLTPPSGGCDVRLAFSGAELVMRRTLDEVRGTVKSPGQRAN